MKKGWIITLIVLVIIILIGGWYLFNSKIIPNSCANAGEGDGAPMPEQKVVTCCSGLTKISGCLKLESDGSCSLLEGCGSICSDCGNNICEQWENKCNCPSDCK